MSDYGFTKKATPANGTSQLKPGAKMFYCATPNRAQRRAEKKAARKTRK